MTVTELKIRLYGDPCLRKRSRPVKEVGPSEQLLIKSMIDCMHQHKGIGLSAPQVGINQRIFVADIGSGQMTFINPVIIKRWGSGKLEEGCLSIPDVTVVIKRPQRISVKYLDEDYHMQQKEYEDLMARVILHETDHLNGKLILDYASLKEKSKLKKQLKESQSSDKVFEAQSF